MTPPCSSRPRAGRRPTFSLLPLLLLSTVPSLAFAVDKSKFRTCAQTSFCRRHRNGHSASLYRYKLDRGTIQFREGGADAAGDGEDADGSAAGGDQHKRSESASAGGGGGLWKSVVSRLLTTTGTETGEVDPYVRGPEATLTGTLRNTSPNTSTGSKDESLELAVHLHSDGVARVRITEKYGTAKTKFEKARWTSDELILNAEEMVGANEVKMIVADDEDGTGKELLTKLVGSVSGADTSEISNYVALRYGSKDDGNDDSQQHVLLIRLEPFSFYLFRGADGGGNPPIVAVGERDMIHFEIRRAKPGDDGGTAASSQEDQNSDTLLDDDDIPPDEEELRQMAAEAEGAKDDGEDKDKHGGKEIVGYWEDGLAIYADGTREEKPTEDSAEEVEHRKLLEEQASELDREGLWEENFHEHKDSKPFGPMSVGMDIGFPDSTHLFGLPEHASTTQLQTTHGPGAKYHDPYRLYNLDVFEYELDETMALYGEIPLVVSQSLKGGTVGAFWFNPTETFVDVYGADDSPDHNDKHRGMTTHFMSESGIFDLFLLPGPDPAAMYGQYARLTGRMPLPPMFSLGYHQCRWNYRDEPDVYAVHDKFEELDYPYDVLWLDIEHTDGKRYFTWDSNTFPNPKEMQEKLSSQGRRMVTIIDPHIKRDDNYYIHKEATAKGLYVKDKSGTKDYDGWCWPGSSSYLDFTSDKVRSWWADQFAYNKYQGSTPDLYTWNDMNEPSVFNGPEVSMQKDIRNLDGVEHREWHNLYGLLFHRATASGLIRRNQPDKNVRPFVLSRSFFAGSQRYGAIWTGDNAAEWSHLEAAAPMLLGLNVAALSFVGADVGGFFGDPDAELMTRWMQAGAYQPFFRGHAHHDAKRREPWMFGEETMVRLRKAAMARYALLPFWYTVFRDAGVTGMPVMRTMWMQYPKTESLFSVDNQYMIGSELLVKPITAPGVTQTDVLFPTADGWYDVDTMQQVSAPGDESGVLSITVDSNIDKIPVYQRGGSIIPRKLRLRRSARLMVSDPYTLYVALDGAKRARGGLYMDDEETFAHERKGEYGVAEFSVDWNGGGGGGRIQNTVVLGENWDGSLSEDMLSRRMVERIVLMGIENEPKIIKLRGASVAFEYNEAAKILVVRKPDVSALAHWEMIVDI